MRRQAENISRPSVFKRGFEHVRSSDRKLAEVLDQHGVLRFRAEGELFESLVESILSQQLASPAATAIIRKVRALYPGGKLEPEAVYRTPPRKLRAAGVSPQKVEYLKDLARRVHAGEIELERLREMDDDEIIRILDEVKGVGPWTVQMILIFTLGRPDVFPVDDLGVKKGFQRVFSLPDLPKKAEMESAAERWRPYRTIASLYLWRDKDTGRAKE